jgi:hypothetical protein
MEQYVVKAWEQWMAWDATAVANHLEKKHVAILGERSSSSFEGGQRFRSRRRFSESIAKQHEKLDYQ